MNNRVLVVDDEASVRRLLFEVCKKAGYEVFLAENGLEAVEMARKTQPSVILLDIKLPVMDGMEAFEIIHRENPRISIILMTAYGTVDLAVEAMKRGAFEYLVKPSDIPEVRRLLERALQIQKHCSKTSEDNKNESGPNLSGIIGKSAVMQEIYKKVGRVAPTNATVMITGESGSGKELIARTIYNNSLRRNGPFIMVNCGALPEGLMESELFGYEKGAFTGAVGRKPGRFELAHQGTIFLDEVGDLTPTLQVKLLRVLQEREFERVGGVETIKVDVRIIAATNRDLADMVRRGTFRQDLYFRLNVVPINVPPLRERREDIPLLTDYFVRRFATEAGQEIPYITPAAWEILRNYDWPGNVRELANVLERAVIMSGGMIEPHDLSGLVPAKQNAQIVLPETGTLREIVSEVEKILITRALKANKGNRVRTAQALDISRRTLLMKIEEYGLEKVDQNE